MLLIRSIGRVLGCRRITQQLMIIPRRTKLKRVGDRPLGEELEICGHRYQSDEWTNVPDAVIRLTTRGLYREPGNPIYLVAESLRQHYHQHKCYDFDNPVVSLWGNFDSILVPPGHVSRSRKDTFYVDRDHVLRSHTSAHQSQCFREGPSRFMIIGDVYRRDEVNRTHHAAFHQCEVVRLYDHTDQEMHSAGISSVFDPHTRHTDQYQAGHSPEAVRIVERELKHGLESYFRRLLGPTLEMRWIDAYFPFTHPSWELEIKLGDEWLEMLGCGVIQQSILQRDGQPNKIGWALGIGLERVAMLYYDIPDIRLFWTRDSGFTVQFANRAPFERFAYKPISAYPQKAFDMSFWLPVQSQDSDPESSDDQWSENDVHAIILEHGGELVEQLHLVDRWVRPSDGRVSNCYRIVYRSHERALTNQEVNLTHRKIESALVEQLGVEIR